MASNYPRSYRELHNAKLAIQPLGAANPFNVGNCMAFQLAPEVNRIPVYESEPGRKNKVDEFVNEATYAFDVTIDELPPETAKLCHFATDLGDEVQTIGAGLTATFNGVKKGTIMVLNREGVSNVVVTVGGIAKSPDTDYMLDAGIGVIELRLNTSIADGSNVIVTYDCPATTRRRYSIMTDMHQEGIATLWVKDSFNTRPVEVISGECSYYVTEFGDHDLSKIRSIKLRITFRGTPKLTRRNS